MIRLEETSKAVMELVLEYLYTGHVDVNEQNAYELFAKADYFILPSLKSFLSNFILKTLSLSNCIMTYYFAVKYQGKELQKGARDFILKNFAAVAETDDFLNLNSKQLEEWISSDEITVEGEQNVFEIITRWTQKNGSRKQVNFLDLFRHVRCVYVSRDYLFKVILPHPFVRKNSECSTFVFDVMKTAFDGTEECLFLQSPRNCLKTHEDVIVACETNRFLCYVPSMKDWYELKQMQCTHDSYGMSACHGKLYVTAGRDRLHDNIVERYEPSLDQWTRTKSPEIVLSESAAVTLHGFLYVVGGIDKNNTSQNTVQKYNPETNLWQAVPPLSSPRSGVCAVADGSYLYAIGGRDASAPFLDIVERFDPSKNTWEKLPSVLARRANAGGAAIKQKVFVIGGLEEESRGGDPCEIYNPATRVWSGIPSLFAPRSLASAVSFKGKIFVFGAFRQLNQRKSLQIYDVDKNKWEPSNSNMFFGLDFFKIACLRMPRDVLDGCVIVS